jgi:hypothetical protein
MSKPALISFCAVPFSGAKDIFSVPNVCTANSIALALISCSLVMIYCRKL